MIRIPKSTALSLLALACLSRPASGEGFYRPLYLVEGQLVPYALKLGAAVAPADADHLVAEVDANIIPVLNGRNVLATLGGGWYYESFTDAEISRGTPGQLTGAYGSVFATGEFSPRWYWITYNLYGTFGSSLGDAWEDQDRVVSLAGGGYKLSPNLSFGVVLIYASNYGEAVFIPLPMVNFSSGRFIAAINPPGQLELRFDWTERFRTLAFAKLPAFSFHVSEEEDVLTWSAVELQLAAEIKLWKWTYLQPNIGFLAANSIEWEDGAHPDTEFSETARLGVNLLVVVD